MHSYGMAALLALMLIAPLFLPACGKSVGETSDDATITTRVKTAFINDPEIAAMRIDVVTVKGVVTLSGGVKSKQQEAKAIQLARGVKGVVNVTSTLQTQP